MLKVRRPFACEEWILDTCGCQYGFPEVLVPFKKYFGEHSCKTVVGPTTYDASETKDLDFFETIPIMNKTEAQRRGTKLERRARLHFAVFVDKQISVDILDGSTATFKEKLENFVNDLKVHMLKLNN